MSDILPCPLQLCVEHLKFYSQVLEEGQVLLFLHKEYFSHCSGDQ